MKSAAQAIAAKRMARKAAGLCTECARPRLDARTLCQHHYSLWQARQRRWIGRLVEDRLCACGEKRKLGRSRCSECLHWAVEKARLKYRERKAAGICVECGTRKARRGRAKCLRCANLDAERHATGKQRQIWRATRKGQLAARLV